MRLIEVLRRYYAEFAGNGRRASAWKLDTAALSQLRKEAAEDGTDIVSITSPPTFLGVPIEIVPMGPAQADYVINHVRLVACQRLDRKEGRQWDVFDLDAGEAHGSFYASKFEAERAGLAAETQGFRQA